MSQTADLFRKLAELEQQVQRLKVQAYFSLPREEQARFVYPQQAIHRALRSTRNLIWQQKYAKKIKSVSGH